MNRLAISWSLFGGHPVGILARHTLLSRIGLALLLLSGASGCGPSEPAAHSEPIRPVKLLTLESVSTGSSRTFPAVSKAGEYAELSFRFAGTIAELIAVEGQPYAAGDVLARLDPRDFESRVAEARSTLASAEAEVELLRAGSRSEDIAALEAQLAAAVARNQQANTDFNRQQQMLERGLIARSEFERAETMREVSGRDVDSASQQLAKARTGARPEEIRAAEARAEALRSKVEEAEAALADTLLRAPYDGVAATVFVNAFQEIQAKQAVLSYQNVGGMEIELQVPESLVQQRKSGGTLRFEVNFAGNSETRYPAEFKRFSTEADPSTQTYRLTLGMDSVNDLNIFPGMSANVTVHYTADAADAMPLRVPLQAIGASPEGKPLVWVLDADTMQVSPREISTGAITGVEQEILQGLTPGETIVTAGVAHLRDGMRVRPLNP